MTIDTNKFVYVPSEKLPTPFLHGYAFLNHDLVINTQGLLLWQCDNNSCFTPKEGAYVYGAHSKGHFTISTDPLGWCKLYIYRNGRTSAVSDSFYALCEHAKLNGWTLSVNKAALLQNHYFFGEQFTSYNTLFDQINLVPHFNKVCFDDKHIWEETSDYFQSEYFNFTGSYYDALSSFIQKMRSRVATILKSNKIMLCQADLSGGLDSRVVLSLLTSDSNISKVKFVSIPPNNPLFAVDYQIATTLLKVLNLENNLTASSAFKSQIIPYSHYKYNAIGLTPMFWYPPIAPIDKRCFATGGHSGEIYRDVFAKIWPNDLNPLDFFSKFKDQFFDKASFEKATDQFSKALTVLEKFYGQSSSLSVLHYLAFRNRYHYGRELFKIELFSDGALLKVYLSNDTDSFRKGRPLKESFFYYDLINSTCKQLLDVRFDKAEKNLSDTEWANLLDIRTDIYDDGSVYYVPVDSKPIGDEINRDKQQANFIEEFCTDYFKYSETPQVKDIYGKAKLLTCYNIIKNFKDTKKLFHPSDLQMAHQIIAIGMFA